MSRARGTQAKRPMLPWALLIGMAAGAAAALVPFPARAATPETATLTVIEKTAPADAPAIVARVNGEPIMHAQWQRMLADPVMTRAYQRESAIQKAGGQDLPRWTLQKLIDQRLLMQEAARRGIEISQQELNLAVLAYRSRFSRPKKFQIALTRRGLDEDALRELIRTDLLVTRLRLEVIREVRVTDAEVKAYYETHKDELRWPAEVMLRIIAVPDKATADEIAAAARDGEAFDRLARQRSMQPRAELLGDGRWFALADLPPPLREAVRGLEAGATTNALQGGAEYIVVHVADRRPERPKTMAEARPSIEQRLLPDKRLEALEKWQRGLREKASIEVLAP